MRRKTMTEQNIRSTFCITLLDGSVVIFEADDRFWYEPCWAIHGEDKDGQPTVRFMPVQKYGMSKAVKPFLREHYLCLYPAEPGIEEHYKSFVGKYHEYVTKQFD
jgi:hypothetical protein